MLGSSQVFVASPVVSGSMSGIALQARGPRRLPPMMGKLGALPPSERTPEAMRRAAREPGSRAVRAVAGSLAVHCRRHGRRLRTRARWTVMVDGSLPERRGAVPWARRLSSTLVPKSRTWRRAAREPGGRAVRAQGRDHRAGGAVAGSLAVHCHRHGRRLRPRAWWTVMVDGSLPERRGAVPLARRLSSTLVLMEPSHEDFVLLKEERALSLQEYRDQLMPRSILLSDLPPGQVQGLVYPLRLCREAQRLFFLCIRMMDSLIVLNHLPTEIREENIVLTLPGYRPKLCQVLFIEGPPDDHVTNIMDQLADIFQDLIRQNHPQIAIPAEVHNLLCLMRSPRTVAPRTQPDLPLMKVHSAMVPLENRGELFVRIYQYTMDVLRLYEPSSYRYVIKEIVYGRDLERLVGRNVHLKAIFERGSYDPLGVVVTTSQEVHCKYHRNGPCHCLEGAADSAFPHGLRYTATNINHGMYLISELLIASMQAALHLMGHLEVIHTESLIPWD